jgi:hypothetical protein
MAAFLVFVGILVFFLGCRNCAEADEHSPVMSLRSIAAGPALVAAGLLAAMSGMIQLVV